VLVTIEGWEPVELPDEWWIEAGMSGFVRRRAAYRATRVAGVCLVNISDIVPFRRAPGVAIFKEDGNKPARQRVTDILVALASNTPLPPIELSAGVPAPYRFRLYNGMHRL
jgi:hypothetical protein